MGSGRTDRPDIALIWKLRLGSEQEAIELAAELDNPIDDFAVSAVRSERDVILVIAENSELLSAWTVEALGAMERSKPPGYAVRPRPWWWSWDSP